MNPRPGFDGARLERTSSEPSLAPSDSIVPEDIVSGVDLARTFLAALMWPDEPVTFQTFPDREDLRQDSSLTRIRHACPETLTHILGVLEKQNDKGAGVFVTVNATDGDGRKTANITRVRAVFVDLDGSPLEPVLSGPLAPSITVESSPGRFHVYWIVTDLPLEDFSLVQIALARRFGGDEKVHDLPRVMRVPGFTHGKGEPFQSRVLEMHPERVYTRAEVLEAFPAARAALEARDNPEPQASRAQPRVSSTDPVRRYALAALEHEVQNVLNAPNGSRNDQLNKSAFALGQLVGAGALSESIVRAALEDVAQESGLLNEEPDKTRGTITSGLEAGMLEPRDLSSVGRSRVNGVSGTAGNGSDSSAPERPEIVVNDRFMRDIAEDALAALEAANDPPFLFRRGGALVRVTLENSLRAEALGAVALKGVLDRVADFVKITERAVKDEEGKSEIVREVKPARPPMDIAPDLLARPELPFPKLNALASTPVYARDGALIATEGFHAGSGVLLRLDDLEGVRTDLPAPEALELLTVDVLGDFPFTNDAGRAHALAMFLQPFVRDMIDGPTPMYLIEAPTRGTGKGLLGNAAAHIVSGVPAPVMFKPRDGDELEKRITAALLEGSRLILLDNVVELGGEALAAALTATIWQGRVLGASKMARVPNDATWIATGNNVVLDDDMPRRVVPIRLDPGVERPEERQGFRHPDLIAWVRQNRSRLVSACLSLVEAWKAAGMPKGSAKPLGTYESWTGIIGGILEVAGVPGFLGGREYLYGESNREPQEWARLLRCVSETYGERAVTARDVFEIMQRETLLLDLWGGRKELSAQQRVGRALGNHRDRVFGGFALKPAGRDSITGSNAYRVEAIEPRGSKQTPETPGTPRTPSDTSQTHGGFSGVLDEVATQPPDGVSGPSAVRTEFSRTPRETQTKPRLEKPVLDGAPLVSGVSGVIPLPRSPHDLAPAEGEL